MADLQPGSMNTLETEQTITGSFMNMGSLLDKNLKWYFYTPMISNGIFAVKGVSLIRTLDMLVHLRVKVLLHCCSVAK